MAISFDGSVETQLCLKPFDSAGDSAASRPSSCCQAQLKKARQEIRGGLSRYLDDPRMLRRDLKLLVEMGLAREIGPVPTDPTKYYEPLL
jgi:hypothetical protein